MKCLILAAGYATRLYPLTENFPKPLLEVKGRTIMDILIDDVSMSGEVDEYIVVSNSKFYNHFVDFAKTRKERITVLDDGTSSNETRLGAVRDIEFALKTLSVNDDIFVMAGDNLVDFSLTEFIRYAREKETSCVMRYTEENPMKLTKSGVLLIGEEDRVLKMWEKPKEPQSDQCSPPFYFFTRDDALLVSEALSSGAGADAPGSFIEWLAPRRTVHAMVMPGRRYDIGTLESYEKIKREYTPL